jgi:hypothetical protein
MAARLTVPGLVLRYAKDWLGEAKMLRQLVGREPDGINEYCLPKAGIDAERMPLAAPFGPLSGTSLQLARCGYRMHASIA